MKPRSTAEALAQARRFEHSARAMSEQSPKNEHVDYKRWHERMGEDYSRAMQDIIKLQTERDRLSALNGELAQFVEGCANVFALQAFRDQADPDTMQGWVKLKEQARSLLSKIKG